MGYRYDLKGQKINKLLVLEFYENKNKRTYWKCLCDCGKICIVDAYKLRIGHTKSCGCLGKLNKEKLFMYSIKHNKTNSRLYRIWQNMKRRCDTSTIDIYKYYGARGIKVYEEWKNDFMSFYNWSMENGYRDDLTIDRIDVNGNYEPSNCRWVDKYTQANNTRRNHYITYKGQTLTINEWSRKTGVKRETIKWRLNNNFPINEVLSNENYSIHHRIKIIK